MPTAVYVFRLISFHFPKKDPFENDHSNSYKKPGRKKNVMVPKVGIIVKYAKRNISQKGIGVCVTRVDDGVRVCCSVDDAVGPWLALRSHDEMGRPEDDVGIIGCKS